MDSVDLHRNLSHKLVGLAMDVHNSYGSAHKEIIYERALAEKLRLKNISFLNQPKIPVLSVDTGLQLGWYQPDFLIEGVVVVEMKATSYPIKAHEVQLRDYLRASKIELGYIFNFGSNSLYFKRVIYTNAKKLFPSA